MRITHPLSLAAMILCPSGALAGNVYLHHLGTPGEQLGLELAAAGDVDGDGVQDWISGAPAALPAGRAVVRSGRDGQVIHEFLGSAANPSMGRVVGSAGDLDGDGRAEPVAGGTVSTTIFDGASGTPRFVVPNDPFDFGPRAVAGIGDLDGDGTRDFLLGTPQALFTGGGDLYKCFVGGNGRVDARSGSDGSLLHAVAGGSGITAFGGSLAVMGDVDGDGIDDFAAGSRPNGLIAGCVSKLVRAHSGATGAALWSATFSPFEPSTGQALAAVGDVDGDGTGDLAIGRLARVELVSGASGASLWMVLGDASDRMGESVAAIGDSNGDGLPDVLAGAPQNAQAGPFGSTIPIGPGYVRALSGVDGSTLVDFAPAEGDAQFGHAITGLGDVNEDGAADFAASAPFSGWPSTAAGSTFVVSTVPLALAGDVQELSLASGGTLHLELAAELAHAGQPYLLLGSASGIAPGIALDGFVLPLALDAYTLHTLANPNGGPLFAGFGQLDANGEAAATFHLPAGTAPALAGTVLYHAYFAFTSVPVPAADFASTAAPLVLLP